MKDFKDIYELLNESNIDLGEIEEIEVSELERKRGKKKLMKSIKNKKSMKRNVAVVASAFLVVGVSFTLISKPAWAMNIPIIGDLIQSNLINFNNKYQDYLQAVGTTKSSNGIDITFESAIADNNILNLSFIVKNNNEPLGDDISSAMVIPTFLEVNGKKVSTAAGGSYEIIDEHTVRILKNISWNYGQLPKNLNIDIYISEIFGKQGNWDVSFSLDSKDITDNTYVEKINKIIKIKDTDYTIDEVTMTPLTTNIKYSYKYKDIDPGSIGFIVIDNNGNEVKNIGLGSGGNTTTKEIEGRSEYISNENTESINIIPVYENSKSEEKLPSTKIDTENFQPIILTINEDISVSINNCTVEEEFIVFEYNYIFNGTKITNLMATTNMYINANGENISNLSYSDEDDNKISSLYNKYSENNKNGAVSIYKIGQSRDIEIGFYDFSSKVILKDEAFTVSKK